MSEMQVTGSEEAMASLYAQCAGSVVGGSSLQNPRTIGGVDDLKDYANSVMSKAKEKLIRDIARDMKNKFKVEGKGASRVDINPESDLATLISQLKKAIPDPNSNGRVWSSQLGSQKSACKQLAKIINERYGFTSGTGMIDENADPEEVCEKVSEVMYTLFVGMHGEFLNVREDTLRLSKNLHMLEQLLERNFNHLITKMQNADPETIGTETKLAREGHQMILDEIKRQQAMLDNTLNVVITPEDKDLVKLLKQSKDFKKLVKKIKTMPGTGKFGEKVAYVLSGVGTTAQMAQVVNEALKKVSLSLNEYGTPKSTKALEDLLNEKLRSKLNSSSARDLEQYMKAARVLYRFDYRRPEIIAELSKRGGDSEDDTVDGSADADAVSGGLRLDKRVRAREDLKKALVTTFNKQLGVYLERVNVATEAIARATGSSVPVTDALRQFTKRLELIPDIEKRHIFFALTGYYNDPASKQERGLFLDNANAVVESLEKMVKMSEYSKNEHMRDLLKAWQSIVALVHDYASRFEKGFGAIAPQVAPSKFEKAEDAVLGSGPWWTAVQKGLEKAGVTDANEQSKYYAGEDGNGGIKAELTKLKDAGQLPWEKFASEVARLVSDATGKKVSEADIQHGELAKEIAEAQARIAERGNAAPGVSSPKSPAKKAPAKAKGKKSHGKVRKTGHGEEEDESEDFAELPAGYFGGEEDDMIAGGAITVAEISRLGDNLNHSKDVMRYFFRAADIRKNMAYVAPELKEYGKDYEKVLGDAVAGARDNIMKAMNAELVPLRAGKDAANPNADSALKTQLIAVYAREPGAVARKPGAVAGSPGETLYVDEKLKEIAAFKEKFYTTKIDMLKCAEAMDLYMKHFTDGIVANVDDVQKIEVMLRGTEIISKWFSSRSGNLICSVFDTFPGIVEPAGAGGVATAKYSNLPSVWDKSEKMRDLHYYWRVQSHCHLVNPGQALANVQSVNASVTANRLATRDTSLANYEKLLTANGAAVANWGVFENTNKFTPAELSSAHIGIPGIPYMGITPNKEASGDVRANYENLKQRDAAKAMEYVTKAFENVSVLKNLIAAFVAIGDRFGGQDIRKKIHMSPVQIYNSLINYMTVGSFTIGVTLSTQMNKDTGLNVAGSSIEANRFTFGPGMPAGVHPVVDEFKKLTVAMRHCQPGVAAHNDLFRTGGNVDTDQMFVFVIKAMVAKILTVIGVYNMLNRPIDRNALGYASATRWTLGGSDAFPKVIPEALELYVRLPLLAEFYRETFQFEKNTPVLSMVPHMEGTFQGLIELIFDRAKHIQYGTYSETDVKTMIEEINKIYMAYKGSKTMVADVMHEFVAEVNRRYGILLNEERVRYQKMEQERYKDRYSSRMNELGEDRVDYDILPEELGSLVGPSDSFITEGSKVRGPDAKEHKWNLNIDVHQKFIRQLRMKMDDNLNGIWPGTKTDTSAVDGMDNLKFLSFENLIKARTEEMKYARSAKEQFRIVQQAINGLGEFSMNSQERSLILFHETVVTGLNVMMALYATVKNFHTRMWQLANTVSVTQEFYKAKATTADATVANLTLALASTVPNKAGDAALLVASVAAAVDAVATHAGVKDAQAAYAQRFVLKQDRIAQEFIELLYGHCSTFDGLIELQVEVIDHPECADAWLSGVAPEQRPKSLAISVDHSKMYELVERELLNLKNTLDKFRGLVPKEIISSYEQLTDSAGGIQLGSIYWLEKHFVHELLSGKVENWEQDHLGNVNSKTHTIINYLTKPWKVSAAPVVANVPFAAAAPGQQEGLGRVIQHLVTFQKQNVLGLNPQPVVKSGFVNDLLQKLGAGAGAVVPETHVLDIYDATTLDLEHQALLTSPLWMFNKLVAGYLQLCYDAQSEKIYVNTINNFANGTFSDSVMKDNLWFDDMSNNNALNRTADVNNVLCKSLALVMRQLLVAKYPGKTFKHYVETDLAEIPLFIKEGFRANMPVFIKLFSLLIKKCELLKNFVQAFNLSDGVHTSAAVKLELTKVLDQVIAGSNSLISCMNDVLEELGDAPLYLETHKDSIKEYESLNGMKPIMPLSSVLYYLQNGAVARTAALPGANLGSQKFKLLYGTRGILSVGGAYDMSKLPGMKDILQKHNETTESEYHIDEKSLSAHVSDSLLALRYVLTGKHYANLLTSHLAGGTGSKANTTWDTLVGGNNGIVFKTAAYSIGSPTTANRDITSVLQVTESNKQRDARQNLVKRVEQSDKTIIRGTREQIRMMNIIDMNIVPINVHALMREMPLVNLMNYSYTFDSMVCNLMGLEYQHMVPDAPHTERGDTDREYAGAMNFNRTMQSTPIRERARKFLGYMLLHPYIAISDVEYHDYFGRIVRGATGIAGLGRPKFLGDELYNKALFGEVYSNVKYYDEAGPAVGDTAGRAADAQRTFDIYKNAFINRAQTLVPALDLRNAALVAINAALPKARDDIVYMMLQGATDAELVAAAAASLAPGAPGPLNAAFFQGVRTTASADLSTWRTNNKDTMPKNVIPENDNYLHYLQPTKDGRGEIVGVDVGGHKKLLQNIGKLRFDTFYCRSLVWLTNLQRVLRLKLRNDLEWYDSRIVKDNAVTSPDITELYGNDSHSYKSTHYSN